MSASSVRLSWAWNFLLLIFSFCLPCIMSTVKSARSAEPTCRKTHMSFCRKDFARALSKSNSIAISLTVSSKCDGVTVFNESPLLPTVQGYLSCTLPGSFQKTPQAILGLQHMNKVSHTMSECTLVSIAPKEVLPSLCALVFWLVSTRLRLCIRQNKNTLDREDSQANCDFCPTCLSALSPN